MWKILNLIKLYTPNRLKRYTLCCKHFMTILKSEKNRHGRLSRLLRRGVTELTFYRCLCGCSVERRLERAEVTTWVYEIVRVRDDSGSDHGTGHGRGQEWSDSRRTLRADLTGLADGSVMGHGCEESKVKPRTWSSVPGITGLPLLRREVCGWSRFSRGRPDGQFQAREAWEVCEWRRWVHDGKEEFRVQARGPSSCYLGESYQHFSWYSKPWDWMSSQAVSIFEEERRTKSWTLGTC